MSSEAEAPGPRSRLVLIGDPDWDTRTILARALEHTGYVVRTVDDGDALLDVATDHGADAIIAEIYLRCRSGPCTVECLKRDATLRHIPVLVYTSRVLPSDEAWAREIGANRYLRKPASLDALLSAIADLTARDGEGGGRRTLRGPAGGPRQRKGEDAPRA